MSGDVGDRKRLVAVNPANVRNNRLYIRSHHDMYLSGCW